MSLCNIGTSFSVPWERYQGKASAARAALIPVCPSGGQGKELLPVCMGLCTVTASQGRAQPAQQPGGSARDREQRGTSLSCSWTEGSLFCWHCLATPHTPPFTQHTLVWSGHRGLQGWNRFLAPTESYWVFFNYMGSLCGLRGYLFNQV